MPVIHGKACHATRQGYWSLAGQVRIGIRKLTYEILDFLVEMLALSGSLTQQYQICQVLPSNMKAQHTIQAGILRTPHIEADYVPENVCLVLS